jgi:hypothetical protein
MLWRPKLGLTIEIDKPDIEKEILNHEVETECPGCKHKISFKLEKVGKSIICPGCKKIIDIN